MKAEFAEYYDLLWEIYDTKALPLSIKYRQMRELLERFCRLFMQNENLQMTDLSARITFLGAKYGMDDGEQYRLHTFRLTANDILNRRKEATEEDFLRDLKTLAFTFRKLFEHDIPANLYAVLPKHSVITSLPKKDNSFIKRLRVCFLAVDDDFFYAVPLDTNSEVQIKVRWNVEEVNDLFNDTVKSLWSYAQLNLLDVTIDEEGVYTPSMIVLEPDYMLDISSLAECFKEYGSHPSNYILSKLAQPSNAKPILIGNIANLFLDEWINADKDPDYMETMQKAFRKYALEIASCEDLLDPVKEREFFTDCKMHFNNIGQVIKEVFPASGYELKRDDAVLEPAYICEALGIQGRLDYMQRDMKSFIEMKSGKADEYAIRNKVEPKENHRVQMLLYMAVLEFNMGQDHRKQRPYLLYTRYPLLYPARSSWKLVKRAINVRNLIVADEYTIQLHNNETYSRDKIQSISSEILNQKKLTGRFWENYLRPSIDTFRQKFLSLDELEQKYYLTLYNFITKEQYLSKSGDTVYEGRTGASSLWLSSLEEKCEAGEILYDLRIIENRASDEHKASISLSIPVYDNGFLPNFRQGDVVVLYERNTDLDNVTNKLVFKGSIESITVDKIKIRLRATQQNISIIPEGSLYAIEHDSMDTAFKNMYQSLTLFSEANKERRDLLLGRRDPSFDLSHIDEINDIQDDFERVALKVNIAQDYFLLVGPPGTGKTSRALKRMVEVAYADNKQNILLLAYTNRAVDEICKSILTISPKPEFIRIGSELSCEGIYREYLIENVLSDCKKRVDIYQRIRNCRVFVGTIASIANKPELFKLKSFDCAIIDEATQILEPQLLGLLCAKDKDGRNSIGKFVLIGDHKQLPAVVLQNREQTCVSDKDLNQAGLNNLADSLFERLYRRQKSLDNTIAVDMLKRQGRMHPQVAMFPNNAFYKGQLESVGLPHQNESLPFPDCVVDINWQKLLQSHIAFLPSKAFRSGASAKMNLHEAQIVAKLAFNVYKYYGESFESAKTLGIITPYRSQIAMIRNELMLLSVSELNNVTIDTVERFQGSERDVVIYSLSVNYNWQLKQLINVIEDENLLIDRKLNVALTRARKQLYIIGVPEILKQDFLFEKFLNYLENGNNMHFL